MHTVTIRIQTGGNGHHQVWRPDRRGHRSQINSTAPVNQASQNIGRLSSSCGSIDAMNKRKSTRITGVFVILFGFMPLLNSLSNPRLAAAHGSDRLQLIAVGCVFRNWRVSIGWLVPLSG